MKWTPEEEETLRTLWGGLPAARISKILGRGTCAVIGKAHRMGLPGIKPELRHEWLRQGYRRWMEEAGIVSLR